MLPANTQNQFYRDVVNQGPIRTYTIPGRKASIDNGALDDLRELTGNVTPRPAGASLELVSADSSDSSAGTGVQTVEVHYLDSLGAEQAITIPMAGLVPVDIDTELGYAADIADVQWIHSKTVGTGGVAAGNITLRTAGGAGTDYELISGGGNQSLSGRYTIPAGHTGYIIGWQVSGFTQRIDFRLRSTVERFTRELIPGVFLFQDVQTVFNVSGPYREFRDPLECPAGSTVKISGVGSASGGVAGGAFDITIVPN
jgi:hypothetical protein